MKHMPYPRPGTEGAELDGITRATCMCGRPITYVDGLLNQASHWRHGPKRKVIR